VAHVATQFTREAMCARTIEVYEELLFPDLGVTASISSAAA
jgi:hypothetical protein